MMKRLIIIAAVTALAWGGFSHLSKSKANEPDASTGEEEVSFTNIPLTPRQVKTAGLSFGQVKERDIDTKLTANGQIVLRAKDKGGVASLMGGIVKNIYVTDGQHVTKGQTVATIENTDIVSL